MKINDLIIASSSRPKIIAEIGINHGGSFDVAIKMAELAIESGADIVKTQLHIPFAEMSPEANKLIPGHCTKSIFKIMEECCLPIDQEFKLKEFIESLGAEYLSTPFSAEAAHILGSEFRVHAFKIGSGECNNIHVLKAVAKYQKPVIISTGMNSLASCQETYSLMAQKCDLDVILMHTTNLYPTPAKLVRLGGLQELQRLAGVESVGLSDHTTNNLACLGAVALGAVLLERHFTDSKDREGPDIINSMTPLELADLRRDSEQMFLMRGGTKEYEIPEEQGTRDFAFATIVSTKTINIGDTISEFNTAPKRPALGDFSAREYDKILGLKASTKIEAGVHLLRGHLCI
jgi:N-acetylneuraminate synthase